MAAAAETKPWDRLSQPGRPWWRSLQALCGAGFGLWSRQPAAGLSTVRRMRRITLLAVLADVAVAAIIPVAWFLADQSRLHGALEIDARLFANEVAAEARRSPEFWNALVDGSTQLALETLDIARRPDADEPNAVAEERQVLSGNRHVLIVSTTKVAPAWPWLVVHQGVMDGAARLGEVVVARSLRPALLLTAAFGCGSIVLGLIMFVMLRITPLRMLEAAIERASFLAAYDPLTALPNRRLFRDRLEQALADAGRDGIRAGVYLVDLDHFQAMNDLLGHPAGDLILRLVAERLRGCLRANDTLARLGGDEFAVIQAGVRRPEDVDALGQRLIAAMATPIDIDGQSQPVGISVGVTLSEFGVPQQPDQLLKQADMALHQAKQEGRGRLCFFAPDMNVKLRERHAMETDLRAAAGGSGLMLHYQPQVDLRTGRVLGAEALLRWNRPGHGMVPPDRFIGLAEDTGLIVPIGAWVLREACRCAAAWPESIGIAVNVSTMQLRQAGFCQVVADTLRETGLAPGRLELEITESILMQDTSDTLATLQRLRELGTRLAMDDFGTGYSSLGYLQKIRFDKVKIDRSFVSRLGEDAHADAIVRAVIGMTDALGVRVVAEGVETRIQADALRAAGCFEAQGYLYGRPVPAEAFAALLHAGGMAAGEPVVTV